MRKEKELESSISLEETHRIQKTEKAAKNLADNLLFSAELSWAKLRTITILSSAKFEAQSIFLSTTKESLNFSLSENGATFAYSIDCVYLVYSDLATVFSDLPSMDQDSKISSKKSGTSTGSSHVFTNSVTTNL